MTRKQPGRHRRPQRPDGQADDRTESDARAETPGDGNGESGWVDDGVRDYIAAIPADFRPLFDRFHRLILDARPDADVILSYQMPSYQVGGRRLYLGIWKHGLSVYGWQRGEDDDFVARHPELKTSTGTLRVRPEDAADISDDEILGLVHATLGQAA
jgi:hypothetical protein